MGAQESQDVPRSPRDRTLPVDRIEARPGAGWRAGHCPRGSGGLHPGGWGGRAWARVRAAEGANCGGIRLPRSTSTMIDPLCFLFQNLPGLGGNAGVATRQTKAREDPFSFLSSPHQSPRIRVVSRFLLRLSCPCPHTHTHTHGGPSQPLRHPPRPPRLRLPAAASSLRSVGKLLE